ncbi:YncE family protein [Castellaniella caeni]|uniref:YncE family protein n=1 Tax=Castellaniella caeni TaxID=266123 RepID=UPI00082C4F19|nr:YncE family protein [Castellaniella caeni]
MTPHFAQRTPLNRVLKTALACALLGLAAGCATQAGAPADTAATATVAPQWAFQAQAIDLVPGVYQGAYSARSQRLYVASAVGRPPVRESKLVKFDPSRLRIETLVTPAPQASRQDGQVQAAYGIAVDDTHGQVWTSNTRSGSIAVYRQDDLSLVKQFPDDATPHARDVLIDAAHSRAYVSSPASNVIHVFDTDTLQPLPGITLSGAGEAPKPMSLALDAAHQRLYTVSLNTAEVFGIDTMTGRQVTRYNVPGAQGASGLAVDSQAQRLYVTAQKSGDVTVLDSRNGQVLQHIATGAGALNVAFDPLHRLVYVANRMAGTVTVLDDAGVVQAQIATGSAPNHIALDAQGTAWALVKKSKDDPRADRLVRIEARR